MVEFSTISTTLVPIIGLTGGIGSGKTTVARIFQSLGVPCFNADLAAKNMYRQSESLREWVVERFGQACGHYENGQLVDIVPSELAQIVFHDDAGLRELNARVHPLVRSSFAEWLKSQHAFTPPYCLKESAILFESGSSADCVATLNITANVDTRIERLVHREGWNVESIESRMDQQMTDQERLKRSTWSIVNDNDSELVSQVIQVHHDILQFLSS